VLQLNEQKLVESNDTRGSEVGGGGWEKTPVPEATEKQATSRSDKNPHAHDLALKRQSAVQDKHKSQRARAKQREPTNDVLEKRKSHTRAHTRTHIRHSLQGGFSEKKTLKGGRP